MLSGTLESGSERSNRTNEKSLLVRISRAEESVDACSISPTIADSIIGIIFDEQDMHLISLACRGRERLMPNRERIA